jgi:GntR family transcriptional regulator
MTMKERIDRTSPLPLYHQIAEAVRNRIATGELAPGSRLPPVREAAGAWGVNMHTVRRAYGELQREGLVRVDGARGTEVVGGQLAAGPAAGLEAFLDRCVRGAREGFGLGPVALGELLLGRAEAEGLPVVHFLECSRAQAAGHCEELERAWRVRAVPLVLGEVSLLPPGPVVGTYFHYNEVRQRWPQRLEEVRFVAIAPDPGLAERLPRSPGGGRRRLVVCELDAAKAQNIAADLHALFAAESEEIVPRVLRGPGALPRRGAGEVLLVSPRVWGALSERQRERVVHIRYRIRAQELEALGGSLGWLRALPGGLS